MPKTDTGSRIDWVGASCRLLHATAEEFRETRPFAGLTIGTAIHLEPKTAALLATLQTGGARLIATGNLNSTQAETDRHRQAQWRQPGSLARRRPGPHCRRPSDQPRQ